MKRYYDIEKKVFVEKPKRITSDDLRAAFPGEEWTLTGSVFEIDVPDTDEDLKNKVESCKK